MSNGYVSVDFAGKIPFWENFGRQVTEAGFSSRLIGSNGRSLSDFKGMEPSRDYFLESNNNVALVNSWEEVGKEDTKIYVAKVFFPGKKFSLSDWSFNERALNSIPPGTHREWSSILDPGNLVAQFGFAKVFTGKETYEVFEYTGHQTFPLDGFAELLGERSREFKNPDLSDVAWEAIRYLVGQ